MQEVGHHHQVCLPLHEADVSQCGSAAGTWLEILASLVAALGVPHRIVAGGGLVRGEGQDRIAFLASARNAALEPLWLGSPASTGVSELEGQHSNGSHAEQRAAADATRRLVALAAHTAERSVSHDRDRQIRQRAKAVIRVDAAATAAAADVSASPGDGAHRRGLHQRHSAELVQLAAPFHTATLSRVWRSGDSAPFRADRALFLNDVYFCAAGALRLLGHDADLACGMDFDRPTIRQMSREVRCCCYVKVLVYATTC